MIFFSIIFIIFSNQYLLINEEFFIILAFFALCYLVKTNLGPLVESELNDRKTKTLNSYLEYLAKKSKHYNNVVLNNNQKVVLFKNYAEIELEFFTKFVELLMMLKIQSLSNLFLMVESNFISYFAVFVSKKRKFI